MVTRLEYFCLLKQLQQTAAAEERVRLARDLHDGLLQSLTGAALQLETVHRLIREDPQAAQQRLLEVQRLIAAEQKDLRFHIRELKPSPAKLPGMDYPLATRLMELTERIERHWGLRVEMLVRYLEPRILGSLAKEIYFLCHEGLINAARHANASAVRAEINAEDNCVNITVSEDGHGFTFQGRYDHTTLTALNLGPVTLRERTTALGGSLNIESTSAGTRLEITIPITSAGGYDAHPSGAG